MRFVSLTLDEIQPNGWNPNLMTDRIFEAEVQSFMDNGIIDPLTIRETSEGYEIIDGEHRWKAASELLRRLRDGEARLADDARYNEEKGWHKEDGSRLLSNEVCPHPTIHALIEGRLLPCINLGRVSERQAKKLTVIFNETRGRAQEIDLSILLGSIHDGDLDDLARGMPYSEKELLDRIEMSSFDWRAALAEADNPSPAPVQEAQTHHLEAELSDEQWSLFSRASEAILANHAPPGGSSRRHAHVLAVLAEVYLSSITDVTHAVR